MQHSHSTLSAFQQAIVTLMRLHLGLSGQDLGYRFGVYHSTVSWIFATVIDVLYAHVELIVWPEKDVFQKTIPVDFRMHCAVIINCFEIFID